MDHLNKTLLELIEKEKTLSDKQQENLFKLADEMDKLEINMNNVSTDGIMVDKNDNFKFVNFEKAKT